MSSKNIPEFTFIHRDINQFPEFIESEHVLKIYRSMTMTDLLKEFEQFLRGCGYYFDGEITLWKDEGGIE